MVNQSVRSVYSRRILGLLLAFLSAICLFGCGIADTADHMNGSMDEIRDSSQTLKTETAKMAGTLENTSRTLDSTSQKMDRLGAETGGLHSKLVEKESAAMMNMALESVFGSKQFYQSRWFWDHAKEPSQLVDAELIMGAAWQEFWDGAYDDDQKNLDGRYYRAIRLLLTKALSYVPADDGLDVGLLTVANEEFGALCAISARLEYVLDRYKNVMEKLKSTPDSLYDVMVAALKNRYSLNRTERFPRASQMVLQEPDVAIYLLQLRHNFLPMMVLARLTDFKDKNNIRRAWDYMVGGDRSWRVDLKSDRFTTEELVEWTNWLKQAKETREALSRMDIPIQYTTVFKKYLNMVDFNQVAIANASDDDFESRGPAQRKSSAEDRKARFDAEKGLAQAFLEATQL